MADQEEPYFVDDDHARYAGWVVGFARRHGVHFKPVFDDDGNYTDRLELQLTPTATIIVVVPPPPEDWVAP